MWGDNKFKQIEVPREVQGHVVMIALGAYHTGVVLKSGEVRMWGDNRFKQIEVPRDKFR